MTSTDRKLDEYDRVDRSSWQMLIQLCSQLSFTVHGLSCYFDVVWLLIARRMLAYDILRFVYRRTLTLSNHTPGLSRVIGSAVQDVQGRFIVL